MNKYLITGATGFVGSWITRSLVSKGEDVSIIVRNENLNWRLQDIKSKVHIYKCDLQSSDLEKTIDLIKPNVVIHLAAHGALPGQKTTIEDLLDTNVKGLIKLIHAVKKYDLEAFINTGSSSEYGIKNRPMVETDFLQPINDYGVSKSSATLYAQKIAVTEGLPIVTLRLFSPYGYYDDPQRLISYIIERALKNESISLSSKDNVRDFIYIEDVVRAYELAVTTRVPAGEIINIGSGKQHTVYDIVEQIIAITGSKSKIEWNSMPKQSRQIEPQVWEADITKAKELLQWSPGYSLQNGLEEAIKQYQK